MAHFLGPDTAVEESAGNVPVVVRLDYPPAVGAVVVGFTVSGTALTGEDVTLEGSTVTFLPEDNGARAVVVVVEDDTRPELVEWLAIILQPGTGYTLGAGTSHTITINDDDPDVQVLPDLALTAPTQEVFFAPEVAVAGWCEWGGTVDATYLGQPDDFLPSGPGVNPVSVACVSCVGSPPPDCGDGPDQRGRFSLTATMSGLEGDRTVSLGQTDRAGNAAASRLQRSVFYSPQVSHRTYVKASNTGAQDTFGWSVAMDADTLVVGSPMESSGSAGVNGAQDNDLRPASGAVYVFVRHGSAWSQQAYLKASNPDAGDGFGGAVAIHGDTVVVGAVGESSAATGVDGNPSDDSAPSAGAAYVFVRTGEAWSQQAYLKASNTAAGDLFGAAVAVRDDTVAVGATGESSNATGVGGAQGNDAAPFSGAVYVFSRASGAWVPQAYVKATNTGAGDGFGAALALDVDTLVVGAPDESSLASQWDDNALSAGAVYVYTRAGTTWSQPTNPLKAGRVGAGDMFGASVSLSLPLLVVGAPGEESNATGVNGEENNNDLPSAGAAYLFELAGTWQRRAYLKATNTGQGDRFGTSVRVRGGTVVVGAPEEDGSSPGVNGDGNSNQAGAAGAVYLFVGWGSPRQWQAKAYVKASNAEASDGFGWSVAVSGSSVVAAAPYESSSALGLDGNQGDNLSLSAGAVYLLE